MTFATKAFSKGILCAYGGTRALNDLKITLKFYPLRLGSLGAVQQLQASDSLDFQKNVGLGWDDLPGKWRPL